MDEENVVQLAQLGRRKVAPKINYYPGFSEFQALKISRRF